MADQELTWHKSRRSGAAGHCVETAFAGPDDIRVRDSKNPSVVLYFNDAEWNAFTGGVKDGEFDHPTA